MRATLRHVCLATVLILTTNTCNAQEATGRPTALPAAKQQNGAGQHTPYWLKDMPNTEIRKDPVIGACCQDCRPNCNTVAPRLSIRHDAGDGVGFEDGFTYVELFYPLWQPDENSVWFSNFRTLNFDDDSRWEFQAGGGYRVYQPGAEQILGANLFYDGRQTESRFFHQLGLGVEILRQNWEARANGYIVLGPDKGFLGAGGIVSQQVTGNLLVSNRLALYQRALSGCNAEIGAPVPMFEAIDLRVFAGAYHYSADGLDDATGARGRLEAHVSPNVSLHLAVQHDDLFDTTVYGGIAIHFGGNSCRCGPTPLPARLGDRVVRDPNIVITGQTGTNPEFGPAPMKPAPPKKMPVDDRGDQETEPK